MHEEDLIPHLFRTEYRKIVSVLCALFGIEHIEIAEDIVSDSFLAATELWMLRGVPENPTAWLYTVAKNKTRNYLKRNNLFEQKIAQRIRYSTVEAEEMEIDLSPKNMYDSQLAMLFAICSPSLAAEAQIALALNILCGFGAQEIADAFLTSKEVMYKRLQRAKEKLKTAGIRVEQPLPAVMDERLDNVLTALYLLFNEGYYSTSGEALLRNELCEEAMRLLLLLDGNAATAKPAVKALLALMYFHSSRFAARVDARGDIVLYEDQDSSLWDHSLIAKGIEYLNNAATGSELSRYHLEAAIAYWHTQQADSMEKWENILQLYNQLLQVTYSPMAALNRTFALAKANGKEEAIIEAEKLCLTDNPFYFSLLGHLYTGKDNKKALQFFQQALLLSKTNRDRTTINRAIERLC